ncbi:6-hydroxy-D-nicotine oxidase [Apiospora sp. TS-2023a]
MKLHESICWALACLSLPNAAVAGPTSVPTKPDDQFKTVAKASENIRSERLDYAETVDAACKAAELALGSDTVDTAPLNQTVVEENWSQACIATPYCIIQPSDADAVATCIRIFASYKVKFAVRSGGHSSSPGSSSIGEMGILLDMQRMNQVQLGQNDSVGLAVVGGRVPGIGVGGFLLGGGMHTTSGEYGTGADNVKNFEVVLSDSSIVNANASSHADLFWALKGGGPNFGLVTRFDVYTTSIPTIWIQASVYPVEDVETVLDAFYQWQTGGGAADLKSNIGLSLGIEALTVVFFYAEPSAQTPAAFAPFENLQPLQVALPATNATFGPLEQLANTVISSVPRRTATSRMDAQLYKDTYSYWYQRARRVHETTGANQTFTIEHVPATIAKQGVQKGGNPMNIPAEDHTWWETLVDWEHAQDDDTVRSVAIDTTAEWDRQAKARGLHLPFLYMNHAARDQDPLTSYGSENLAKLRRIAQKYDPSQLFQTLQNGGFLLSRTSK